ncbi:MAG: hypothetical protein JSW71_17810 [Gemmatimonadota bacterium]|nr:MAG: hypothetical protein JSW71_17810 [Gemmatimonadota bacterium]
MQNLRVILLMVLGVGCSTTTGPQSGDEFQLRVGESAALEDVGLWLAFLGVSEDSRCPRQLACLWEGDAAVLVETAPFPGGLAILAETAGFPDFLGADSKTDTLHTSLDPKSLRLGPRELVLVGLDPYPETPSPIPLHAYVARFIIRPAQ